MHRRRAFAVPGDEKSSSGMGNGTQSNFLIIIKCQTLANLQLYA